MTNEQSERNENCESRKAGWAAAPQVAAQRQGNEMKMADHDKLLTPERMQELGAYIVAIGDNGPLTRPEDRMRFEKWQLPTNQGTITIFHDWHTDLWHIQRCEGIPFRYEATMAKIFDIMNIDILKK